MSAVVHMTPPRAARVSRLAKTLLAVLKRDGAGLTVAQAANFGNASMNDAYAALGMLRREGRAISRTGGQGGGKRWRWYSHA